MTVRGQSSVVERGSGWLLVRRDSGELQLDTDAPCEEHRGHWVMVESSTYPDGIYVWSCIVHGVIRLPEDLR